MGVRPQCSTDEVVDTGDGLNAGKASAGDNKRQQRLYLFAAISVRLLEVSDQMVAHSHGVTQRLHSQRMFLHSRKPIGVGDGAQAENQKVKFEGVRMGIEAMGNNDPLSFEINLIHFACQEVHAAQHFADGIHNCREVQIAGRDFVKHWREQEKVLTVDKCDLDRRIAGKFPLQFHGHREAGKTSAYNEYALWCFVFHEQLLPASFCSAAGFSSHEYSISTDTSQRST